MISAAGYPRSVSYTHLDVYKRQAEYVAGRYNCYGSLPEKLTSPLAYFRNLEEKEIAFDTVGIQLYFPARDMVALSRLLDAFKQLGKPIHITEMGANGGVRSLTQAGAGSSWSQLNMSEGIWHEGWGERTQADWMEYMYTILAARDEIKALTWWDFIEPSFFGNGAFPVSYTHLDVYKSQILQE